MCWRCLFKDTTDFRFERYPSDWQLLGLVELAGEPGELLALLALPGLGMLLRDAAHGREDVLEGVVESVGCEGAGVCCCGVGGGGAAAAAAAVSRRAMGG